MHPLVFYLFCNIFFRRAYEQLHHSYQQRDRLQIYNNRLRSCICIESVRSRHARDSGMLIGNRHMQYGNVAIMTMGCIHIINKNKFVNRVMAIYMSMSKRKLDFKLIGFLILPPIESLYTRILIFNLLLFCWRPGTRQYIITGFTKSGRRRAECCIKIATTNQ